jgi:hypothetical protein
MRLFAVLLCSASPLAAQGQAPSFGCPAPANRQFDFWLGDWNVTAGGKPAGTNLVTSEESGCVLHEHWRGARGGTGQSFNFYDSTIDKWHQLWVDNQGSYLHLTGTFADGRMVLEGTAPGPDGKPQQQRLTFFKHRDGSVRQLWEMSADEGKTWTVAFDGLYTRK